MILDISTTDSHAKAALPVDSLSYIYFVFKEIYYYGIPNLEIKKSPSFDIRQPSIRLVTAFENGGVYCFRGKKFNVTFIDN